MSDYELLETLQCKNCGNIQLRKIDICEICNELVGYEIPENLNHLTFNECKDLINKAFFKIESFMNDRTNEYYYFGFNDYFTKLFFEGKKYENFTIENFVRY